MPPVAIKAQEARAAIQNCGVGKYLKQKLELGTVLQPREQPEVLLEGQKLPAGHTPGVEKQMPAPNSE